MGLTIFNLFENLVFDTALVATLACSEDVMRDGTAYHPQDQLKNLAKG